MIYLGQVFFDGQKNNLERLLLNSVGVIRTIAFSAAEWIGSYYGPCVKIYKRNNERISYMIVQDGTGARSVQNRYKIDWVNKTLNSMTTTPIQFEAYSFNDENGYLKVSTTIYSNGSSPYNDIDKFYVFTGV